MSDKPFPIEVSTVGREEVCIKLPNGTEVLLCAHGAATLGHMLTEAAGRQYCDGYRHGDLSTMYSGMKERTDPVIEYTTQRVKPLAELRPSDVPMGMDPDDLATDLG